MRVASFPSAGATLMPLAVAAFRRAHPEVALTLAEGELEDRMDMIALLADVVGRYTGAGSVSPPAPPPPGPARRLDRPPPAAAAH